MRLFNACCRHGLRSMSGSLGTSKKARKEAEHVSMIDPDEIVEVLREGLLGLIAYMYHIY